jgi:X-X-X-Leu-X-X-Gly heptad repeat protein
VGSLAYCTSSTAGALLKIEELQSGAAALASQSGKLRTESGEESA